MKEIERILAGFKGLKIMVIGDLIADEFILGQPERLSREAPVIILRQKERGILPGGGANAARNILSLGGKVKLVGLLGDDEPGHALLEILQAVGFKTAGIIIDPNRVTAVKTRILAGGGQVVKQQVVRVDNLDLSPLDQGREEELLVYISREMEKVDAVLLSDYGLGLFSARIRKEVINLARAKGKLVAVDTRYNLLDYQGATIATPNLEEISLALGREVNTQAEVIAAGKELLPQLGLDYLLITQGGEGMTLFTADADYRHVPAANYSEVYDVTGAGDTVVAALTLALALGVDVYQATKLANYAAGIVVRKSGVAAVTPEELLKEVLKNAG